MELAEMRSRAAQFGARLDEVKAELEGPSWGWYPWKIVPEFIDTFNALLTGENRRLFEDPAGTRVADIGAADGDLAFFFASIGFTVDIIDGGEPSIREQRLQPARMLKRALDSPAEIHGVDLDHDFELPHTYDVVFLLGVLYHLRNPFLALETLAGSTRHCIISTKVARYARRPGRFGRGRRLEIAEVPVAYLLDTHEASEADTTNYWVFSEAGLRRLVERAGWTLLDYHRWGNLAKAEPGSTDEARVWCLLRSEVFEEA
jgi:tRNA (mo5U34)-methyltransferase